MMFYLVSTLFAILSDKSRCFFLNVQNLTDFLDLDFEFLSLSTTFAVGKKEKQTKITISL